MCHTKVKTCVCDGKDACNGEQFQHQIDNDHLLVVCLSGQRTCNSMVVECDEPSRCRVSCFFNDEVCNSVHSEGTVCCIGLSTDFV